MKLGKVLPAEINHKTTAILFVELKKFRVDPHRTVSMKLKWDLFGGSVKLRNSIENLCLFSL